MAKTGSLTVRELLTFLCPELADSSAPPAWPPDAFAMAAVLILESGIYLKVVSRWPPSGEEADGCLPVPSDAWADRMGTIGSAWRAGVEQHRVPLEVRHWWKIVHSCLDRPLSELAQQAAPCHALLQLCAAADEACQGVGFPFTGSDDYFNREAEKRLVTTFLEGSTLCRQIHHSRAKVLPKAHTPQNGLTLASLTHNLALWVTSDVVPHWYSVLPLTHQYLWASPSLNVLLVPWPEAITPTQFRPAEPAYGELANMPEEFKFFTYCKNAACTPAQRRQGSKQLCQRLEDLYHEALALAGRIEMVILPELALESQFESAEVYRWARSHDLFLVCGVAAESQGGSPGRNYVTVGIPFSHSRFYSTIEQNKHHRWRLDRTQIVQYGLGGQLDPESEWWEHTSSEARQLTFVSILPWLSLSVLVCEDLARQEPVARLVRTVGPNLVIALLMDGPQLEARWPARYATVLADDPGCSVLTLTSVGMAELCRPQGRPASRSVALWKDAKSGMARQIELPAGYHGLVLNLTRQWDGEWTADGRYDGGRSSYPILGGVHPVRIPDAIPRAGSPSRGKRGRSGGKRRLRTAP